MTDLPVRNALQGGLTFEKAAYFPVFTVFGFVFFHMHNINMNAGTLFYFKNEF